MQYLPPPSLQTAEHAEKAVRRDVGVAPHVVLLVTEDVKVPGAFMVPAESAEAAGTWWYGVDAQVREVADSGYEVPERDRIVKALDTIERALGSSELPITITPDVRIQGAVYITTQDENTIDHWVSPTGSVVLSGRINAVPTAELSKMQTAALNTPEPDLPNSDIAGILLP